MDLSYALICEKNPKISVISPQISALKGSEAS